MKIIIGFCIGIMVSGLILLGIQTAMPTRAQSENLSAASDNFTQRLIDLLPDIEKIYRDALTAPFIEAEKKISDNDIAQFYHQLIENTVLNNPE